MKGLFPTVLDRRRITSTVAVLASFLAFSLLLGELIFSADCDLRVVHTKANLVEYVLVVDRVNLCGLSHAFDLLLGCSHGILLVAPRWRTLHGLSTWWGVTRWWRRDAVAVSGLSI